MIYAAIFSLLVCRCSAMQRHYKAGIPWKLAVVSQGWCVLVPNVIQWNCKPSAAMRGASREALSMPLIILIRPDQPF